VQHKDLRQKKNAKGYKADEQDEINSKKMMNMTKTTKERFLEMFHFLYIYIFMI
jgi:hypothetical protein